MTNRTLTIQELNRATLARQLLLAREKIRTVDAIARLVGLQAQSVIPPYVGLWTRLEGFRRQELTRLVERRKVVRATMMRHTLHLVGSGDFLRFRSAVQPALTRAFYGITRKRVEGLDLEPLLQAACARLEKGPATFAELRELVAQMAPEREPSVLAYAVRTFVPLVQIPADGRWGYSTTAPYALAEDWLGKRPGNSSEPRELILRYLAAFGPSSVKDIQAWSGLAALKPVIEDLKPELRILRDEHGAELLDVPGGPLPPPDTPVPVRLLPEFDNLLLAHADRSRVISDRHRRAVFLSVGRVRATFLVDGFVRGTWRVEKEKAAATLVVEPFGRLAREDRDALVAEAERLIGFVEEDAEDLRVRIAKAA